MLRWLRKRRESINLFLYDRKGKIDWLSARLMLLSGLAVLVGGGYSFGFAVDEEVRAIIRGLWVAYMLFFVAVWLLRLIATLERKAYLRQTWSRLLLAGLFGLELVFLHTLGMTDYASDQQELLAAIVRGAILLSSFSTVISRLQGLMGLRIKPGSLFLLSFVGIIAVGAAMLMTPEMTTGEGLSFLDALFTSTSATCVTGLIVVDTATAFTNKGQWVLLVLMQFGGIGMITFASFFALVLQGRMGVRQQTYVRDVLSGENLNSSRQLLSRIVLYTLFIEAVGGVMLYVFWLSPDTFPADAALTDRIFFAAFHAVSAFCNAGFSLFSAGLADTAVTNQPMILLVFSLLIILGALGFPAMQDIFGRRNLRERLRKPWKSWQLSTRIAVNYSMVLVALGTLVFYAAERQGLLAEMSLADGIIHSVFQSVTTRTAGFNSVDMSAISSPVFVMFIFLMFIGGSSGSTAGGIKTSTLAMLMASAIATVRGKSHLELGKRSISVTMLNRAFAIMSFALAFVFLSIFILSITEPDLPLDAVIFEVVSAFCTVGLSQGITAEISDIGRAWLIVAMFIGRVGTLTFAVALARPVESTKYSYPESNIMVG